MYKALVVYASILGLFILLVNTIAGVFYWYDSISWFDMFMHTVGGVFVAVFGGAIMYKYLKNTLPIETFINLMLFVLIVILAWEYYEYIVQIFIKEIKLASIPDSVSDLICGMIGGTIGSYLVIIAKKRYNKNNVIK